MTQDSSPASRPEISTCVPCSSACSFAFQVLITFAILIVYCFIFPDARLIIRILYKGEQANKNVFL